MSSNKIGFYFESQLPDIIQPLIDDFSFFYIKNEKSFNSTTVNIPDLFLYNKTNNSFIQLSVPDGYYVRKLNGNESTNGVVNISLQDISDTASLDIDAPIIFNGSKLFSEGSLTMFSDFSVSQLSNYQTNIEDSIFIGNSFGNTNIELKSINNIFIGQNQKLLNNNFTENIIIGNNLENLGDNTYSVNNNLFLGGLHYSEIDTEFINNNIIQDNIFIKNLGYGNLNENFKFVLPIILSNNTKVIDITADNSIDKNTDSVLIGKGNNPLAKLLLKDLGLNTILGFNNYADKNILLKNRLIGDYNNNFLLFEDLANVKNSLVDSTVIGSNTYPLFESIESLTFGNNNYVKVDNSKIIGNNNFYQINQSLIIGDSNGISNTLSKTNVNKSKIIGNENIKLKADDNNNINFTNNIVLGDSNVKTTNLTNTKEFNNNIIVGSENISESNSSNDNIIVGNGNLNNGGGVNNLIFGHGNYKTTTEKINDSVLIGNGAEYFLNNINLNEMLVVNHTNIANENNLPLILGSFNKQNPWLTVNGKFSINPIFIDNSDFDVSHTKVVTINSDGEFGATLKTKLLPDANNLVYRTGTEPNKNITGTLVIEPNDTQKSGLNLPNIKSSEFELTPLNLISTSSFSPSSISVDSQGNIFTRNDSGNIQKTTPSGVITNYLNGQDLGYNILAIDGNIVYTFKKYTDENYTTPVLKVFSHNLNTETTDYLIIDTDYATTGLSLNSEIFNPQINGNYIYIYAGKGVFIKINKNLTDYVILTGTLINVTGFNSTATYTPNVFKIFNGYIYTVLYVPQETAQNKPFIFKIDINTGTYETIYDLSNELSFSSEPELCWFDMDKNGNFYVHTNNSPAKIISVKNDLTSMYSILINNTLLNSGILFLGRIYENFIIAFASNNNILRINIDTKEQDLFGNSDEVSSINISTNENGIYFAYNGGSYQLYSALKQFKRLYLFADENGEIKADVLKIKNAAKGVSGIINSESLQELGGADKKINDVTVGRGKSNRTDSVAFGYQAADSVGNIMNTAIGAYSLNKVQGSKNTGVGAYTLNYNTGSNNTGVGANAGSVNKEGSNNLFLGANSGSNVINDVDLSNKLYLHASENSVGSDALLYGDFLERWLNINGKLKLIPTYQINANGNTNFNKKLVWDSLSGEIGYVDDVASATTLEAIVQTGNTSTKQLIIQNINVGNGILNDEDTTAFGRNSLQKLTAGAVANTAFGADVLQEATTAKYNAGFGDYSLWKLTTGIWNAAFGSASMPYTTTGSYNVALASGLYCNISGSYNSALGRAAGMANVSGSRNTYVGNSAGYDNGIGSNNVAVGDRAMVIAAAGYINGIGSTISMNNNVFIGSFIRGADGMNDTLAIDNQGNTQTLAANSLIYGGFSAANRFVKFNGALLLNTTFITNADGDSTYNKYLVMKADGTVGMNSFVPPTITTSPTETVRIKLITDLVISTTLRSDIPGFLFNVTAGKIYKIKIFGAYKTVAATTGGSIGFILTNGGVGTIFGTVKMNIVHTNTAAPEQVITNINTVATTARSFATSTGVGAANIPEVIEANLVFECTTNGTFNVQWGSEIASSAATLMKNTFMEITEI